MSESSNQYGKFDPVKEFISLRDNLSHAVSQALNLNPLTNRQFPALNIFESDDDEVVVRTQIIEGLDPKSLEITVEENVLSISGEISYKTDMNEGQYFLQEIPNEPFSRSIRLPDGLSQHNIEAKVNKNGVLQIRFSRNT